jgi:putative tricarboxylic transport membrane protein
VLREAGFVVSTAFAAAALSWRLGSKPVSALIAGIVIAVAIYVIFNHILGLSLARGPWGF